MSKFHVPVNDRRRFRFYYLHRHPPNNYPKSHSSAESYPEADLRKERFLRERQKRGKALSGHYPENNGFFVELSGTSKKLSRFVPATHY